MYQIAVKNLKEFNSNLESKNIEYVKEITTNILNTKKNKTNIFQITCKNKDEYVFSVDKKNYKTVLKECMDVLLEHEEYMLCHEIKYLLK